MNAPLSLTFQERVMFALRDLYRRNGYSQYRMSKFEEYDLYARNKDFLISDGVITFMDTNGKLMALKPDVTLSIVKNSRDDGTLQKLYYNENVYRVSKSTGTFRELMQVGLECLGPIDRYCICEVLALADESLASISPDRVLNISHLGLLTDLLEAAGIPPHRKADAMKAIGEKNIHELSALCRDCGVSETHTTVLTRALRLSGPLDTVLPRLRELLTGTVSTDPLDRLLEISAALGGNPALRFDFSTVGDTRYYNGIVFKGFLRGLPGSVLSGGQYDRLMQQMERRSGAIGFAVYLDALERLEQKPEIDVDTLLLYDETTPPETVSARVRELQQQGKSVLVQRQPPEGLRCRQIIRL